MRDAPLKEDPLSTRDTLREVMQPDRNGCGSKIIANKKALIMSDITKKYVNEDDIRMIRFDLN